tara:strand:+ start:99049 stop:100305 length:1257 start_codon:yes stop_codon:yes gene_type:complete
VSSINKQWEKIMADYRILDALDTKNSFEISSREINKYKQSRLMCKIDFKKDRPKAFRENNLSVLAINNGNYKIARTDPFLDLKAVKKKKPEKSFELPRNFISLQANNITSESKALDAAKLSGMLDYLCKEKTELTIRGREYCQDFDFYLADINDNKIEYNVSGVQIEVDGGYENSESIVLIEAKMGLTDDMNIRQLLYPHMSYQKKYKKKIATYLMFYEVGGYFHFIPFEVIEQRCILDFKRYRIFSLNQQVQERCKFSDIKNIDLAADLTDRNIPFPQANSFEIVLTTFYKLAEKDSITKEKMFLEHDISLRQWDYYSNVLLWMQLVEKNEDGAKQKVYSLTERGKRLINLSEKERIFEMAKIIFSNEVVNLFLNTDNPNIPKDLLIRNKINPEADTFPRRMNTVKSWKRFFKEVLK